MTSFAGLVLLPVLACGGPTRPKIAAPAAHVTPAQPASDRAEERAVPDAEVIQLEPLRIEVVRDSRGDTVQVQDARDLFDAANEHLVSERYDDALTLYRELLVDFSDSSLVGPALYNAGLAAEGKGDYDGAVALYRQLVTLQPTGRDSLDALVRAGAVLSELERWPAAVQVFDDMLARSDLTPSDRLEAMARRGYVQIESKDYAGAEKTLGAAIADHERLGGTVHLESDYYVAMSRFYLAEIPRRQFQAIPVRLPESQMAKDLEAKSGLVLLAGERFNKAIAVGNVYWATASGYRLASMQKEFWDAIVLAPLPPTLSPEEARLYVQEVHKLAARHLTQALSIHRRTVELAELYQTRTQWSDASKAAVVELTELLAREQRGELGPSSSEGAGTAMSPGGEPARSPGANEGADYVPARAEL